MISSNYGIEQMGVSSLLLQNSQQVSEFLKPAREGLGVRAGGLIHAAAAEEVGRWWTKMGRNLCQGTSLPRHRSSHRLNHSPGTNNGDKDLSESNGLPQSSRNVPPPPPPKLSEPQLPPRAKSRSMDTSQGFHCGLSQECFLLSTS